VLNGNRYDSPSCRNGIAVGGFSSLTARGFWTEPPAWVSSETASAVLRLSVTVSTIASSSPLSFCLSVRRNELPTWSVTTSALAGDSTLICCCETSGTFWLTTTWSVDKDAESSVVPVPSPTSVASMSRGTLVIRLVVYVVKSSAAISRAAPRPMIPHAANRNMTARFTSLCPPRFLALSAATRPEQQPGANSFDPNSRR
jgi:hypothetical protein